MTKKEFALRLGLYILFSLIIPISFLAWRFKLFDQVTKISFSVWGLIAVVIVIVVVLKLFNGIRKGLKHGISKQVVDSICNITIPLLIVTVAFDWMSGFSKEFVQFLIILIISETIGGIVNPLPQWCYENKIEQTGGIIKEIFATFQKK